MDKKIALTYLLRFLGVILVCVYFFGLPMLNRFFPGFPISSLNYFFYAGLLAYLAGALLYYLFRKKIADKKLRDEEDENG